VCEDAHHALHRATIGIDDTRCQFYGFADDELRCAGRDLDGCRRRQRVLGCREVRNISPALVCVGAGARSDGEKKCCKHRPGTWVHNSVLVKTPFGSPTSMARSFRALASWFCVAAFQRVCLCRGPSRGPNWKRTVKA